MGALNKRIKVLVVDDSVIFRRVLANAVESDIELDLIATAHDAFQAIDIIEKNMPDVITLDIEMPQMDGYSLTKQIKSNRMYSHIPVVIFSSLISPDIRKKGDAVGADAQITKPELAYLLEIVDEIISKLSKKKIRP